MYSDVVVLNKVFSVMLAILLVSITGCTRLPMTTLTSQLENKIWDARNSLYVSQDDLITQLEAADYILLGETHDNPEHHEIQTTVLQQLLSRDIRPAIVMEMLDLSDQAALDKFKQTGSNDPDAFEKAVGFSKKGWDWPLYRSFIKVALEHRLVIRAGNLPRAELNKLVKGDPLTEFPKLKSMLDQAKQLPAEVLNNLRQEIALSHCGKLPDNLVDGMMSAQTARDAMLALQMKNSAKPVILITGSGHARRDRAVPFFLADIDPETRVISLGMKGVDADFNLEQKDSWQRLFDYSWYTKPVDREDPCKNFKLKSSTN